MMADCLRAGIPQYLALTLIIKTLKIIRTDKNSIYNCSTI